MTRPCALALGAAVSNRSPAISTTSTSSSRAVRTMLPSAAACSSWRSRPLSTLPTCQSLVCKIFIGIRVLLERRRVVRGTGDGRERVGRAGRAGVVTGPFALLAGPGRPGGEREVHRQRHRDVGLGDEHGAGLGQRGALPLRGRQVPVLGPFGFGGVEPAGDADRAVGHDAPLYLAGRLLG